MNVAKGVRLTFTPETSSIGSATRAFPRLPQVRPRNETFQRVHHLADIDIAWPFTAFSGTLSAISGVDHWARSARASAFLSVFFI